jgi:hypothetical protein
MFSDHSNDGSGAAESLRLATKELLQRIATLPAPTKLQLKPSASKASQLPVGISGPVVRQRHGSLVRDCSLQVLLPRYGQRPRNRNIYIGTENTYTKAKFKAALAKAVEIRREAEEAYRVAETRARRAAARELKAMLAGTRPIPASARRAPRAGAKAAKTTRVSKAAKTTARAANPPGAAR